jgi:hypothetical protein
MKVMTMNENVLAAELRTTLLDGLTRLGIDNVQVKQSYQPTAQGLSQPCIFIHKISQKPRGHNARNDKFNEDESIMVHTDKQVFETVYQVSAAVDRDVTDAFQLTASDLVRASSRILASEQARAYLLQKKIGIIRVADIINPFFIDDRERNESSPSFDVTLTHEDVRIYESEIVQTVEHKIYRI